MTDPASLPKAERSFVSNILDQVPAVAKRFSALLCRKAAESLTHILDAAADTPSKDFATSLQRDVGAIQAAPDLPWRASPVEGQVNRLKMRMR